MMQQQKLTDEQVKNSVQRAQQLNHIIQKHTKQTPIPKDPIQQQIKNIVQPLKQQIHKQYFTQEMTLQQIKKLSIINFFAKTYEQLLVYLIQQSKNPIYDATGKKIAQYGDQTKILDVVSNCDKPIVERFQNLIQIIQNQNRKQFMKRLVIHKLYQSIQFILKKANYQIYPLDAINLLLNQKSVPFELNNQQLLKNKTSTVVNQKLNKLSLESASYQDIVNKQTVVILKTLFKQPMYKKGDQHHWVQIKNVAQLKIIDKQRDRFLQQASVIENFQQNIDSLRIDQQKKANAQLNNQSKTINQATQVLRNSSKPV